MHIRRPLSQAGTTKQQLFTLDITFWWISQGLIHDLETGCPKLAIVECWGVLFSGRSQYTEIITINMCLLIEIMHTILIQCQGKQIKVKKLQWYCLKSTFYEIPHKNIWVSWRVIFEVLRVQMTPRRPAGLDYASQRCRQLFQTLVRELVTWSVEMYLRAPIVYVGAQCRCCSQWMDSDRICMHNA